MSIDYSPILIKLLMDERKRQVREASCIPERKEQSQTESRTADARPILHRAAADGGC